MSISKTSIMHPSFIRKLKAAINIAQQLANEHPSHVGVEHVLNARGHTVLTVAGIRTKPFRVHDSLGNDVTSIVNDALRRSRIAKRRARAMNHVSN